MLSTECGAASSYIYSRQPLSWPSRLGRLITRPQDCGCAPALGRSVVASALMPLYAGMLACRRRPSHVAVARLTPRCSVIFQHFPLCHFVSMSEVNSDSSISAKPPASTTPRLPGYHFISMDDP